MSSLGLTLGKFAPLHKGHEYLIRTALEENDEVVIVVYDAPKTTHIPLNVRADWIRRLFPTAEVIEGWDGPPDSGDSPEVMRVQENYILRLLNGRHVSRFYSSEFYGAHMSRALGAIDRRVDPPRQVVPVSGTAIRANPYAHRGFLSPEVYRDLIMNIVFLGAPSTGKSTLARALADHYHTAYMPEYGRDYWLEHQVDRRLSLEQLLEIAEGHLQREEELLLQSDRVLFTDTNALTTRLFSLYYHGKAHPKLETLADQAARRYDLVFVCLPDIPYEDTWDRSGEAYRISFQKQIVADLQTRKIPFFTLAGPLEERKAKAIGLLERFRKYDNLIEWLT